MKIYGSHAIQMAEKNPYRKFKLFHGDIYTYQKLGLSCQFKVSDECFLEVDEIYVQSTIDKFLDHDKIILLDAVMDPRNVGAIIRTAATMGFYVILRKGKGCPINETVAKCASGGLDATEIIELGNINTNLQMFKNNRFWCVGLHETGKTFLHEYKNPGKIILVIGGESDGISQIVLKEIDSVLCIETEKFSTLNASVAASLGMFYLKYSVMS